MKHNEEIYLRLIENTNKQVLFLKDGGKITKPYTQQ